MKNNLTRILLIFVLTILIGACASNKYYLNNETSNNNIEIKDGETHQFKYVRLYQEGNNILIYGKMKHSNENICLDTHVDIRLIAKNGVVENISAPLVDRGLRRTGWSGAHFRAELPALNQDYKLLLTVHENYSSNKGNDCFDCGKH